MLNVAGATGIVAVLAANPFSGMAEAIAPEPRAMLRMNERLFVLIFKGLNMSIKDKEIRD
jgi:hypothetical protein